MDNHAATGPFPYIVDTEKTIFALDVGTRTVVGLICYPEDDNLRVLDLEIEEHPQRDMLDGQIHHIEGVTRTVEKVKAALEYRMGFPLEKVSVAAAGRALKTLKVKAGREITYEERIRAEEISQLELEGAEEAKNRLLQEEASRDHQYYCVGYTTVQYFLDGHPISSLVSQKGNYIEAEVLATFLPYTVVDSLLTVIENAGLTLHSLTLEPIAAIQALIPPEYRHLNLALVDIGAGTSDLAITNLGSIVAYAMVPLAGDEVTEQLAQHYLLDFQSAENLKNNLSREQEHPSLTVTDIIGNTREVPQEEVLEVIRPTIKDIAQNITSTILYYNQVYPKALFCIGGGSQTPLLREEFATAMELPLERVAIRDSSHLKRITSNHEMISGPEGVTPLGIALSALKEQFFGFSYVTVNGKVIRLLETEPTTVGKCLLAAGFNPRSLIGLRGASIKVSINGQEKRIPGEPGENAQLWVNGELANLEKIVNPNDEIVVEEAQAGSSAEITVEELAEETGAFIYLQGAQVFLPFRPQVNGEPAEWKQKLYDGDVVEIKELGSLEELSQLAEINFTQTNQITVNGERVDLSYRLQPGDRVKWS